MNEMDNDELVSSLEELIDQYEEHMAPYAITLCQKMVKILAAFFLISLV
jgi:hypothetical protein